MGGWTNFCQRLSLWLFLSSSFSWQTEVTMRPFWSQASFRCWMQPPSPLELHYAAPEDPTHEMCRNIFCCEAGWWKHLQNNWSTPLRDVVKELQLDVDAEIVWDSTKSWVCMNKATELCSEPHNLDLWWLSTILIWGSATPLHTVPAPSAMGKGCRSSLGLSLLSFRAGFYWYSNAKCDRSLACPWGQSF